MTKQTEALKMAIEYLTNIQLDYKGHEVRKALQEALAQPAQEPLTSLDEIFADEMFRLNRDIMPLPEHLIHEIAQRNYHPALGINPVAFTLDIEKAHGIGEQACKEALEQLSVAELNDEYLRDTHVAGLSQPAQEPVAWHHYKTFDLIYHDVWEELLEGKDEWYPLDYQENTNLRQVVKNHIEDLRKCIPVLDKYPQMKQTRVEVEKAISELQEALYTHPAPSWQGLSDDEIHNLMIGKNGVYYNFARAIEQALKEKNT